MQTQASNEAAKAKEAFYQKALQDLTLFKSKTNAALLQVCNKQSLLYRAQLVDNTLCVCTSPLVIKNVL